jgi:hypothetical protein
MSAAKRWTNLPWETIPERWGSGTYREKIVANVYAFEGE